MQGGGDIEGDVAKEVLRINLSRGKATVASDQRIERLRGELMAKQNLAGQDASRLAAMLAILESGASSKEVRESACVALDKAKATRMKLGFQIVDELRTRLLSDSAAVDDDELSTFIETGQLAFVESEATGQEKLDQVLGRISAWLKN